MDISSGKRLFPLVILYLYWGALAFAQSTLSGKVTGEKGIAIPFATVMFCPDSIGTKGVLSYTTTDKEGLFSLKCPQEGDAWLLVKSLGYNTFRCRRAEIGDGKFSITLQESTQTLSGVTVKGNYSGVKFAADSIIFDIGHFKTGAEETVGDVLKRLPGVDVKDDGKVSFAGRDLDKVLINGQDMAGSGKNMIINNTPADIMTGAEILRNYKEGSITDDFKSEEKTALNIKTTSGVRLSGTLNAAGGVDEKYDIKPSLFMIKDKFSVSAAVSANNTGEPVFSIEDYLSSFSDIEDMLAEGGGAMSLSEEETGMLVLPDNIYKNNSFSTALNTVYMPSDKLKIKGNLVFNHSLRKSGLYNRDEYYGSGIFSEKNLGSRANNDYLSVTLRSRWKPESNMETSTSTVFRLSDNATSERLVQNSGNILNVSQTDKMRKYYFRQSVSSNFSAGNNILFVFADVSMSDRRNPTTFETDSLLLPLDYEYEDGLLRYGATMKKRYMKFSAETGNAHKFKNGLVLKTSLGYSYARDALKYGENIIPVKWNDTHSDYNSWQAVMRLSRNTGFFRFSLGGSLSANTYNVNTSRGGDKHIFFFMPEASCRLMFSQRQELNLSASYKRMPKDIRYMLDYSTAGSYDKINTASQVSDIYVNSFKASLNYRLFNLYNNFLLFVVGTYSKDGNSVLQDISQDGITSKVTFHDGGHQEHAYLKAAVNKGLGFMPADLKLNVGNSWLNSNSMISGEEFSVRNSVFSSSAEILTRFKYQLNAGVSGGYEHINTKAYHGSTNDMDDWYVQAKLLYARKRWKGNINLRYSHLKNNYGAYNVTDLGFALSYSVKAFTLRCSAENILNLSGSEWSGVSTSNILTSTSIYKKMPGNLLVSLAYRL